MNSQYRMSSEGGNGNFCSLKYPVALFLIVLAASIVAFAVLDCSDEADASTTIDGLRYDLYSTNHTAKVVGCEGSPTDIAIPESVIDGETTYSVTSIGDYAFEHCAKLSSVTIPDSVTSLGSYAFSGCTSLSSVTIPDSVTSIGGSAFSGCTSLASITVDGDNTVYSSQDGVLFNKTKTELILYPKGNTRTSYTIPDSVKSIGSYAFHRCESLKSVDIPDSVTIIESCAFLYCTVLENR